MGIISINNGYWATKVITSKERFIFDSKAELAADEYTNTFIVDGNKYKVGEGRRDIGLDKSANVIQLACISKALSKSTYDEYKIITSLPANIYINKDERKNYTNNIKTLNPKIKDVKIYMEGAAAQLADLEWYKEKLVVLIDIGGLTINIMIFEDGKLVSGTQDTFNLGTIILDNKIRAALTSAMCDNYTDYQIPYLFNSDDQKIKKVIAEEIEKHFEEIDQAIKKKGYPSRIQQRFTGGGALRLKKYIMDVLHGYIGKDPVWENAQGQFMLGSVVWPYEI